MKQRLKIIQFDIFNNRNVFEITNFMEHLFDRYGQTHCNLKLEMKMLGSMPKWYELVGDGPETDLTIFEQADYTW